ncbi:DedA family protein [Heliophilum fasciatum]|uniref:Membrane protein DedA with SNARE-associated domain n=1 Tax=Heliophilum fasciatum TaxID=35700 RepID=A0A4R2RV37_9FIRM|nr:DedA family protein [Heliophilum fasciatum]MCW2277111.1 membrane protein DedA with SNARE-associated domain [Heliophilum fasciatum]TCP68252.1 membrane protein DedA with SNARE-associated domain [Heliophilum fasciatum]
MSQIIQAIEGFLTQIVTYLNSFGYPGVTIGMAIESACIPLPSEIIMPLGGYMAYQGTMTLLGVALAGTIGNVIGSLVAYYAGRQLGAEFIFRYFGWLISRSEYGAAERWFARWGDRAIFISRMLPVIRTFISLPAGIAKMDVKKFTLYTFVGSFPWCLGLAYIGYALGENWQSIRKYGHDIDIVIISAIALVFAWWLWHKIKDARSA